MNRLIIFLLLAAAAVAQNPDDGVARRFVRFNSLPATCNVGDVATLLSTGVYYKCSTINTWTDMGSAAGGSPGGSNTECQYNNAGAFGGITGCTSNGTVVTFVAPVLGAATGTSFNGLTISTTTGTFTLTNAKTLAVTNTLTLSGTDSTTMTFPTTTATIARTDAAQTFTGLQTFGAVTQTGQNIKSLNGAASTPPAIMTGTWFTGGSATTTKPQFLIEPAGATSAAWSTAGTGIGVNSATGFTGRLLDLQLNGVTKLNVDSSGYLKVIGGIGVSDRIEDVAGTGRLFDTPPNVLKLYNSGVIGWSSTVSAGGTLDLTLCRQSAGVLQIGASTGCGSTGQLLAEAYVAGGGTPSVATCGTIGTGSFNTAGFITSNVTGSCVPVLTFSGYTATTGWSCGISNGTTDVSIRQTGSSTTTATFTSTTVSGDVLRYACFPY